MEESRSNFNSSDHRVDKAIFTVINSIYYIYKSLTVNFSLQINIDSILDGYAKYKPMLKTTLFDLFETLPELRALEVESAEKIQKKVTKQISKLAEAEPTIESIIKSLDMQRERLDEIGKAADFRHVDPIRRMEHMASLRHTILYFAQRAFSLPVDYRIFDTFGKG